MQFKVTYQDKTVVRDTLTAAMSDAVAETGDTLRLRTVPYGMGAKRILEIMPASKAKLQERQAAFMRAVELKQATHFSALAIASRDFNIMPGQVEVGLLASIDIDLYNDGAAATNIRVDTVNGRVSRIEEKIFNVEVIEEQEKPALAKRAA
jgi:hypothetical protein